MEYNFSLGNHVSSAAINSPFFLLNCLTRFKCYFFPPFNSPPVSHLIHVSSPLTLLHIQRMKEGRSAKIIFFAQLQVSRNISLSHHHPSLPLSLSFHSIFGRVYHYLSTLSYLLLTYITYIMCASRTSNYRRPLFNFITSLGNSASFDSLK